MPCPTRPDTERRSDATALAGTFVGDAGSDAQDRAREAIAAIREARFGEVLRCPRCHGRRVQRWGHFGLRRRYRCRHCRRTFSDLTGTAFAGGKRPELWLPFASCLLECLSVRAAGRRLGIDKDTAWRWRHHALAAHATRPARPLRGIAELVDRRFGICEKGRRDLGRPALRRSTPCYATRRPSISVLFLRDQAGTSFATPAGPFPLRGIALEHALAPRAMSLRGLVAPYNPGHPVALFAGAHRLRYERVPLASLHNDLGGSPDPRPVRHVLGDALLFRAWLRRFRGVATRYLDRYLHWHWLLERLPDPCLALLVEVGRAPPMFRATINRS